MAPFERVMRAREAEMVKYFGNTWFSTKVVFANQIYDLCEALGIDYDIVKEGASADKRIGRTHLDVFHKGYRGYGGKCLPKDTRALIQLGDQLGVELALLKRVEELNNALVACRAEQAAAKTPEAPKEKMAEPA
jgi:UDP-glucose 6-dehydrogenase